MTNPFAQSPFATSTSATTQEVETTEAASTEEVVKEKKARKPRAPSNRRKTADEVKFILDNYRSMSTSEIARKLELTSQQVSRTVLDARKSYLQKAESLPPEKAQKIRDWVEEHLPSKIEQFGKGGGKRGSMIDNIFDDIFADL